MFQTENSNHDFLPGGCNRTKKVEIWPVDQNHLQAMLCQETSDTRQEKKTCLAYLPI